MLHTLLVIVNEMSAVELQRLAERDAKRAMRFAGLDPRTINAIRSK